MKKIIVFVTLLMIAYLTPDIHASYAVRLLNQPQDRPNLLLSDYDEELYQSIFDLQKAGNMAAADKAISQLKDKRLMGYVLYQRYLHPTAYTSKYDELKRWLILYKDHPGADRIFDLAKRKAGNSFDVAMLRKPNKKRKIAALEEPTMVSATPYHKQSKRSSFDKSLEKKISRHLHKGQRDQALDLLIAAAGKKSYSAEELDYLKSKIAASYLYSGHVQMAYELASQAYIRSLDKVPLAGWVYGLTTWYNGNYDAAAKGFESAAISEYGSGWLQSAASYWAARAYGRLNQPHKVNIWLTKASEHPRTFYGLLAFQASGEEYSFNWKHLDLTRDMVRSMARSRATMRALALIDVGRYKWAEQEFMFENKASKLAKKAMLSFAQTHNMAELSLRLGTYVTSQDGQVYDTALYPEVDFKTLHQSSKGTDKAVDPDLLNAIARQESRFNARAVSSSGAVGLMQLLPSTAHYMAKKNGVVLASDKTLTLPEHNLQFGQYYVHNLLNMKAINGDVVSTLVAYNAGPGNLRKWRKMWSDVKDPLLFIELLPAHETRTYVERVLANYWIYRIKNNRPLKALKPLLMGEPLLYAGISKDLPYDVAQWR